MDAGSGQDVLSKGLDVILASVDGPKDHRFGAVGLARTCLDDLTLTDVEGRHSRHVPLDRFQLEL